jgi:phosphoenolpyruvate carboxylase
VSEERKKRNYADFWTPVAANEPFRVVLCALRDKCVFLCFLACFV